MARKKKDPNQLQAVMTGTELKGTITQSYDRRTSESLDEMWGRKLQESKAPKDTGHGAGIHESLSTKGFRPELNAWSGYDRDDNPGYRGAINVEHESRDRRHLDDGHHKVAAAADIEASSPQRNVWFNVNHSDASGGYANRLHAETLRSISHSKVDPLPTKKPAPNPELDRAISSLVKKLG